MPKRTAHIFEDKWRSDDVKLQEAADFSSLLLSERVLVGLKKAGFKTPSPIQLEAIPVGRFGSDLIVQAKSGTGKTLVFTIIALDLLQDEKHPQVLILAPTREIAFQICDVINSVGTGFKYLKCSAFIGGIPIENDRSNIVGCQIVVGTPGRIKQLLSLKILRSSSIHLLVLDEADQLLENSFKNDIDSIFVSLPKEKQVICTSATYPKTLKKLAARYFRENPFLARLNVNDLALLGTMHYIRIVEVNIMPVLAYRAKMRALEEVLTSVNFSQCLVFCNVLSKVETICDDIKTWGFSATYISSAKEQASRLKAIECLKRFKCKVLVSSDITSRGIDAENVDLIINIDLPYTTEVYLHRVGRAGRYGSKGLAVTFVSPNEVHSFKKIQLDGNFKSYFLPDPIPGNLINQKPDPKAELLKDEISVSESSDEEPSSLDNLPSDSRTIKHQVSNGSGKGATDMENKILLMNSLNLTNSKENNISKDNKDLVGLQSEDICVSENSCTGELVGLLPLDGSSVNTKMGTNGTTRKDSDENENEATESNSVNSVENSNQNFTFTDGGDQSDSLFLEVLSTSEDSCEEKLVDLVTLEQTQDEDVIENNSCSSESPNKPEIKEDSQLPQEEFDSNEVIVPPCNNEEINEMRNVIRANEDLLIRLRKANEDLASTLDDETTDPSDLHVDILTVADSLSNDSEKCELNGNVELKDENLFEVVEHTSLDKESEDVPVTSNVATNPVQVDEVTVSVINFIQNYKKKTIDSLNSDTVAETPMESNSGKPKSLVQELVSDRNRLNDYYYEVFQTYRNENIAGDTAEILELIQDANKLSSAEEKDENCLINESKDVIPISNKMDLSSWSMKLAGNKLNKVELDSTDESTGSSSDCKLESTPLKSCKTKNIQLDVSSDTPSFLNPNGDPDTDDSSSSEYSNKCSKLESALKNKIRYDNKNHLASKRSSDTESTSSSSGTEDSHQKLNKEMDELGKELDSLRIKKATTFENHNRTGNKGQVTSKHSSGTESSSSSSDAESSSSSEVEVTLLERAHREMVEINGKKQSLGEKANVLRRVLGGLEKSKESISDIQITTATHLSKAHCNKTRKTSKSSSSLSSSSSLGNASNAKKSTRSGCSSSESCSKNVNRVQEKYRRFSLSSEISSDDSESSVSYSGGSDCTKKRRNSKVEKIKNNSRAKKTHIQCPHDSFASADQGYFDVNPSQNSSHTNNSYLNHQGESSVHPTHEHDISCYMPSQHQCYSLNGQSSCQSQSCATWYDMFYSQWYFIHQHSSYFQ